MCNREQALPVQNLWPQFWTARRSICGFLSWWFWGPSFQLLLPLDSRIVLHSIMSERRCIVLATGNEDKFSGECTVEPPAQRSCLVVGAAVGAVLSCDSTYLPRPCDVRTHIAVCLFQAPTQHHQPRPKAAELPFPAPFF